MTKWTRSVLAMALVLQAGDVAASDDGSARACWASARTCGAMEDCSGLELSEAEAALKRAWMGDPNWLRMERI